MKHSLRVILFRCRAMVTRKRLDCEFDEELTTHLELLIDEAQRRGLSHADARCEALRKLGRPVALREVHREQRGIRVLDVLAQDLQYAVRMLWKSPAFTSIVTLSLALGIGANTAVFSLVNNLLLRSLPVRQPDRLVEVRQTSGRFKGTGVIFSQPVFEYVRAQNPVFSEVVGFGILDRPVVHVDGVTEPPRDVDHVSENFFRDLGVTPILGRTPEPSDEAVAIVSYRLWHTRFDGSSGVLGRAVSIDGRPYPIIGVAPPRFLGLSIGRSPDLWISSRTDRGQKMIARVKPGVTSSQAQAAMQVLFHQLAPEPTVWSQTELLPAGRGLSRSRARYERPLLAVAALITLVLMITCTNVGNLLMVRNTARRRELTVRVALGARRSRLVLQCLVESALLAALGGILGLVFARWGVSIIQSVLDLPAIPQALAFQADARVLGFAAGVALLCALLFGLVPAWRSTQVDLAAALRPSTRLLGRSLVACQVGLSVLLLVVAGLFVQTLRNLGRLDLGFNPENLLQVTLNDDYPQREVSRQYRLLLDRVAAIPGVRSVTSARVPVIRGPDSCLLRMPGLRLDPDETWDCAHVGPSFFETMGIPVLRGRTFTAADFAQERRLVAISETFAKRYYPHEDPIGKLVQRPLERLVRNQPQPYEIAGIVRDARLGNLRGESSPMLYFMTSREPDHAFALEVRIAGDAEGIARAIGQEVRRVDPRLLVAVRTMHQEIDRNIEKERMVAATSAFFSLLGLLLVSIGIYGVASYTVAQRTNELGIRMALGASRWSVVHESLRDTMLVFVAGLAAGIIAAIAAVRLTASFISDLLFGLTATDAANIVGAVFLMTAVALAACILPARRATRIDPLAAIRHE